MSTQSSLSPVDASVRSIGYDQQSFTLGGRDFFILSGEMHYFRVPADRWRDHLLRMKDAGLNTVSTYVPWSLHEQTEGCFDLSGRDEPNLNLLGFIELCAQMDMFVTLKPGPYILAELAYHGIPRWFFEKYPQSVARDREGRGYPVPFTSYNDCEFRNKVLDWFDVIMPAIARSQSSQGGPVIMMQVCNELGLFQWLNGAGDYSPGCVQAYQAFLRQRYETLDALNGLYGSHWEQWEQVSAPAGTMLTRADHFAYRDWHEFHRAYYLEYTQWLIGQIRKRGVGLPLFHNVPGWVFGRAHCLPVCLSMYRKMTELYPELILGLDHIPENPSYRNFHDDRLANEFMRAMQGGCGPLYIAELQAGTREACVEVYPDEMRLFYKACLANGAVAMNFYMFSQGKNPEGWSVYDPTFYVQTPLDVQGQPGEAYPVMQDIGRLVQTHGTRLSRCRSRARQAILFYPPYYEREFVRTNFGVKSLEDLTVVGLTIDRQMVTDQLLFDGLAKLLAMDGQEFELVDLTRADLARLASYDQLWWAGAEQMDGQAQRLLLEYVEQGGHLICFPTLPRLDLDLEPCRVLADGLGIQTAQVLDDPEGMIRWAETGQEIHALTRIEIFQAAGAAVLARTRQGQVCGVQVSRGLGTAAVLGTGFVYQAVDHRQAYQRLGLASDFRPECTSENTQIVSRCRWHEDGGGYLFLMNYHHQPHRTKALVGQMEFPQEGDFYLPASSALVLPFNMPLDAECTLNLTSSEVLDFEARDGRLRLSLQGHPETPGQMVLSLERPIESISLDGQPVDWRVQGSLLKVCYTHNGQPQTLAVQ